MCRWFLKSICLRSEVSCKNQISDINIIKQRTGLLTPKQSELEKPTKLSYGGPNQRQAAITYKPMNYLCQGRHRV